MDIVIEGRYKEFDYLTVDSLTGKIKSLGKGRPPKEPDYSFGDGFVLRRRGLQCALTSGAVHICRR